MNPEKRAAAVRGGLRQIENDARTRSLVVLQSVGERLEKRVAALWAEIAAAGGTPTVGLLYEHGRLTKILAALRLEIDEAALRLGQITKTAQKAAIRQTAAALGDVTDEADAIAGDLALYDSAAVRSLIGFGGPDSKLPLARMYARIGEPAAKGVEKALTLGIAAGFDNRQIAREIRGVMNTTTAHAYTIARSETNNAYRQASQRMVNANKKTFAGWVWLSALDFRTCPICWRFHGKLFATNQKFFTHPNCRCTLIPLAKGEDREIETGPAAFDKLNASQQRAILGPGRFDLYKAGYGLPQMVGVRPTEYGQIPVLSPLEAVASLKPRRSLAPAVKRSQSRPIAKARAIEPPPETLEAAFPVKIAGLKEIKALGGSTGAKLVEDASGRRFVLKQGNSPAHIEEEFLADEVYRSLGVSVPAAKLYREKGKTYKLAEFIEGEQLGNLKGKALEAAQAALREHFPADVLLSNRDVIGLAADNILVDKAGKVWRIDNGSSFRFRAQGGAKEFDGNISDLWTLRNESVNAQSARVFGHANIYDLGKRMRQLSTPEQQAKVMALLPDELKPAVASRFEQMRDIGLYAADFEQNDWTDQAYVDEVCRHVVGIRRAGITERLPKKLGFKDGQSFEDVASSTAVNLYDENGYKFDHLRKRPKYGEQVPDMLERYMRENGGDPRVIGEWQVAQAGDSWADPVRAFKYFISGKVAGVDEAFWLGGKAAAQKVFTKTLLSFGEETYTASHAQYKAFVMEFLNKTDIPNRDGVNRTLRIIRTEKQEVIDFYNLKASGPQGRIERGLSESYSLVRRYTYKGTENTVQDVAFSDIHGLYVLQRLDMRGEHGSFAGDNENEVTALWRVERQRTRYIGKQKTTLAKYGFKS